MDERDIRRRLIAQFGIRIEPHMSRYLLDRMNDGDIPVMGGDARTGVPLRTMVNLAQDSPAPDAE
jgi:hypothetical protein